VTGDEKRIKNPATIMSGIKVCPARTSRIRDRSKTDAASEHAISANENRGATSHRK
jgi:hypothetical protein